MRHFTWIGFACCVVITMQSCKKDNPVAAVQANPIVGLWTGTQLAAVEPGDSLYYSLDVRADSSVIIKSLGLDGSTLYAIGKWRLAGTLFTATVTGLNLGAKNEVQRIQATYQESKAWLFGGWVNDDNSSGTFTLYRVP